MNRLTYEEKLVRCIRRVRKQIRMLRTDHTETCQRNAAYNAGPCDCGAYSRNKRIDKILNSLRLPKK